MDSIVSKLGFQDYYTPNLISGVYGVICHYRGKNTPQVGLCHFNFDNWYYVVKCLIMCIYWDFGTKKCGIMISKQVFVTKHQRIMRGDLARIFQTSFWLCSAYPNWVKPVPLERQFPELQFWYMICLQIHYGLWVMDF